MAPEVRGAQLISSFFPKEKGGPGAAPLPRRERVRKQNSIRFKGGSRCAGPDCTRGDAAGAHLRPRRGLSDPARAAVRHLPAALLALLMGSLGCAVLPVSALGEDLAPARLLAPGAGDAAPDLAPLRALEGPDRVPVAGQGVEIVHFFATWCVPCTRELPALGRFAARRPEVSVVLVDVAEPVDRVRRFFDRAPPPGPVLLDADRGAARAFGVSLLPATFVTADGRLRLALEGEVAWDEPANDALIDAAGAIPAPAIR